MINEKSQTYIIEEEEDKGFDSGIDKELEKHEMEYLSKKQEQQNLDNKQRMKSAIIIKTQRSDGATAPSLQKPPKMMRPSSSYINKRKFSNKPNTL